MDRAERGLPEQHGRPDHARDDEGVDLGAYKVSLIERLSNPEVADQLSRLGRRGSTKVPSYLLPSIKEIREAGRPAPMLTLALAGWFRYLRGHDYAGETIKVEGPRTELVELARREGADPRPRAVPSRGRVPS